MGVSFFWQKEFQVEFRYSISQLISNGCDWLVLLRKVTTSCLHSQSNILVFLSFGVFEYSLFLLSTTQIKSIVILNLSVARNSQFINSDTTTVTKILPLFWSMGTHLFTNIGLHLSFPLFLFKLTFWFFPRLIYRINGTKFVHKYWFASVISFLPLFFS